MKVLEDMDGEKCQAKTLGWSCIQCTKCCQASPRRAGCLGFKASSVQSDCAQLTPPTMQKPGEAVPELTQLLDCCQLQLVLHGWPWCLFPCTPDSWIYMEGVSAFPLLWCGWTRLASLELRGTVNWMGNTNELGVRIPKLESLYRQQGSCRVICVTVVLQVCFE